MADFVEVARTREIPPGRMKRVEAHGGRITVANVNGSFFAFDDTCTHDGGPLCEGDLDGESVVCPWHFSRFSVCTGEVIDSPAHEPLRTYPVRVEDDVVLVGPLPG